MELSIYLATIQRGEQALEASADQLSQEATTVLREALTTARRVYADLDDLHSAVHAEVEVQLRVERAPAGGDVSSADRVR